MRERLALALRALSDEHPLREVTDGGVVHRERHDDPSGTGSPARSIAPSAPASPPQVWAAASASDTNTPATFQRDVGNIPLILDHGTMARKHEDPEADHAQAERERDAQARLTQLAAGAIAARPWRPAPVPPSAVDLAHFALWRSADLHADDLLSALTLLPAARAEAEGLETGLLFTARGAGLTWAQIADAMGFKSPQACQQHYTRLTARQDTAS